MIIFHILEFKVLPPEKYPDIYAVINVIFSSGIFILTFIYFNYKQMIDLFRKHHHRNSNEKDKFE